MGSYISKTAKRRLIPQRSDTIFEILHILLILRNFYS